MYLSFGKDNSFVVVQPEEICEEIYGMLEWKMLVGTRHEMRRRLDRWGEAMSSIVRSYS